MTAKTLFLHTARALGLFALARWRTRHHIRILCYHAGCVGDQSRFNPKLFCTRTQFVERLTWLQRAGFTPTSLTQAVQAVQSGQTAGVLPVVITIDDGWHSSRADIIEPALAQGFPVTLYVATEVLLARIPVVDVTVRYLVWRAGPKPVVVQGVAGLPGGSYRLAVAAERQAFTLAAIAWLKDVAHRQPGEVVDGLHRLAALLGLSAEDLDLASRRFSYLSSQELAEVSASGCSIELHGHAHIYPLNNPQALHDDVAACKTALLALGLPPPHHYCFPSGEHDAHAPDVLKALQVDSATTCLPGLVDPRNRAVSTFYLPRFLDGGDVTAIEFEAELSGLLHYLRRLLRR